MCCSKHRHFNHVLMLISAASSVETASFESDGIRTLPYVMKMQWCCAASGCSVLYLSTLVLRPDIATPQTLRILSILKILQYTTMGVSNPNIRGVGVEHKGGRYPKPQTPEPLSPNPQLQKLSRAQAGNCDRALRRSARCHRRRRLQAISFSFEGFTYGFGFALTQ